MLYCRYSQNSADEHLPPGNQPLYHGHKMIQSVSFPVVYQPKTKYMVMSRDRNAGRGHSVKIDNSSIESGRVKIFGKDVNRSKF